MLRVNVGVDLCQCRAVFGFHDLAVFLFFESVDVVVVDEAFDVGFH